MELRFQRKLSFEALEPRRVLTTFLVNFGEGYFLDTADAIDYQAGDPAVDLAAPVNVLGYGSVTNLPATDGVTLDVIVDSGHGWTTSSGQYSAEPILDGYLSQESSTNFRTVTILGLAAIAPGSTVTLTLYGVGDAPEKESEFEVSYNGASLGLQQTDYDSGNFEDSFVVYSFTKLQGVNSVDVQFRNAGNGGFYGGFNGFSLTTELQPVALMHDDVTYVSHSIDGGAGWHQDAVDSDFEFDGGVDGSALLYSTELHQSEDGFRLLVEYATASIDGTQGHDLSFGLVRADAGLSSFYGSNPFGEDASLYAIGANITGGMNPNAQGLHFSDGSQATLLDTSGTREQFTAGATSRVTLEVAAGGSWRYRINNRYEASGVVLDGFDLSQSYRFVAFARGDVASQIQSVRLENNYALGDRAQKLRGTWSSTVGSGAIEQADDFETLSFVSVDFNTGATTSANHQAPQKLLEILGNGEPEHIHHPLWGDLSLDKPENDEFLATIVDANWRGIQVHAYSNSDQFAVDNAAEYEVIAQRWMDWCDTDPAAVAYVASQPYITGTWDANAGEYIDTGEFPMRKYYFCYGEFILKDYALRYGPHLATWAFDSASSITSIGGDEFNSGNFEDQRIYQAWADAIHAGNPEIALAWNHGRSTVNHDAFPYQTPTRFDDFTFGHAFGGNNSHADKVNGQFDRNYLFVQRMTETNGYVHAGGRFDWDDKVVGNFSSKLATASWQFGGVQAWETEDFLSWTLEAIQAGGSMYWYGSVARGDLTQYRDWAYDLLDALDDHLVANLQPAASASLSVLPGDGNLDESADHTDSGQLSNHIDESTPDSSEDLNVDSNVDSINLEVLRNNYSDVVDAPLAAAASTPVVGNTLPTAPAFLALQRLDIVVAATGSTPTSEEVFESDLLAADVIDVTARYELRESYVSRMIRDTIVQSRISIGSLDDFFAELELDSNELEYRL